MKYPFSTYPAYAHHPSLSHLSHPLLYESFPNSCSLPLVASAPLMPWTVLYYTSLCCFIAVSFFTRLWVPQGKGIYCTGFHFFRAFSISCRMNKWEGSIISTKRKIHRANVMAQSSRKGWSLPAMILRKGIIGEVGREPSTKAGKQEFNS